MYDCTNACILWGTATYGVPRPDVAAAHGAQFLNSGYTFTKAGLTPGSYYLKVETHSTVTGAWYLYGHAFTAQAGPEHTLSVPTPGQAIPAALSVTGWAIDGSAPSGTGVSAISVWSHRNVGSGESGVWHGFATYGGNRPDVVATHGERFRYSGYTGLFTLAGGEHYLGVSAQSSHTLVWTSQLRTVYVNMPTVPLTIDRPGTGTGAGVTASGLSCPRRYRDANTAVRRDVPVAHAAHVDHGHPEPERLARAVRGQEMQRDTWRGGGAPRHGEMSLRRLGRRVYGHIDVRGDDGERAVRDGAVRQAA